jgi:hypothetical protein
MVAGDPATTSRVVYGLWMYVSPVQPEQKVVDTQLQTGWMESRSRAVQQPKMFNFKWYAGAFCGGNG